MHSLIDTDSVSPAYIVAGILIGPNEPSSIAGVSLTLVEDREFVEILSELGVIFLLFSLGLAFSVDRLSSDDICDEMGPFESYPTGEWSERSAARGRSLGALLCGVVMKAEYGF